MDKRHGSNDQGNGGGRHWSFLRALVVVALLLAIVQAATGVPTAAQDAPATSIGGQPTTDVVPDQPVPVELPTETASAPSEVPTEAVTEIVEETPVEPTAPAADEQPSEVPTDEPTAESVVPSDAPTEAPAEPTEVSVETPLATATATSVPTEALSPTPTATPTLVPTDGPPWLASDKDDYPPGGRVTLTGGNWQPGEIVHITVNDDQGQSWSRSVDVTAEADGTITDAFNLPDWFVATYKVVATGEISGKATTSFTDSVAATASVDRKIAFSNTSGVVFQFTINNTSTASESIGSFKIQAPGFDENKAQVCTTSRSGWSAADKGNDTCEFTSSPGISDNIAAGTSSNQFSMTITVKDVDDTSGNWTLTAISSSDSLTGSTNATASSTDALKTFIYSFEVTDAVVVTTSSTIGGACPSSNKTASPGSTRVIVICGKKYTSSNSTPNSSNSSLSGTLLTSSGTFSSASVTNTNPGVVLANYTGATISAAGSGKTIVVRIGLSNRTSPLTTLSGYSADLANQTIVFTSTAPSAAKFNDTYTPTATGGGSGNPVTFGASGACAYNSGTGLVTMTAVGTCTVSANQAGNTNYNAAPQATQVFTVGKADQTISFGALANKTYGDPDFAVSATASSGLTVSFAASGQCTVSGVTVHLTGPGSCTITASQSGDANYNVAPSVPQTFTINSAISLTINTGNSASLGTFSPSGQNPGVTGGSGVADATGATYTYMGIVQVTVNSSTAAWSGSCSATSSTGASGIPTGALAWTVTGSDNTSTTSYTAFTTSNNTACFSSNLSGSTTYTYDYQLRVNWTDNPGPFGTVVTYTVTG